MGFAWFIQHMRITPIMKWVSLSQHMQISLDERVAEYTREATNGILLDCLGSTGSASVQQQNPAVLFKSFQSTGQEQTSRCVYTVPEATKQDVSTAGAMAVPFVEAEILSSPRQVPEGHNYYFT
jgi:hypothetical protein